MFDITSEQTQKALQSIPSRSRNALVKLNEDAKRFPLRARELISSAIELELQSRSRDCLEDQIARAFTEEPPSEAERKALQAIYEHPGLDGDGLALVLGHSGPNAVHLAIGNMCKARSGNLPTPVHVAKRDSVFWCGTICDLELVKDPARASKASHKWRLKPETVAAFRRLKILIERLDQKVLLQ